MNDVIMIVIMYYCDGFQVHRFIKCIHEGVRGCEGPRVIWAADLPRAKLLIV